METDYKEKIWALWRRISQLISRAEGPQEIISGIAREAANFVGADAASVRLLEEKELVLVGGYRLTDEYKAKTPLKIGEGLVGKVAELRKALFSQNIQKDSRILYPETGKKEGIFSLICVPVIAENELLGTFAAYSKKERMWGEKDAELLSLLAEQLAFNLLRVKDMQRLKERAMRDELTDLYSRSYFLARCKEEVARASREKKPVSFLFGDVDNFKAINKLQGYKEGDKILCQVAKTLNSCVREEDIVCRYGGDEFALLLPRANSFFASKVAERIHKKLSLLTGEDGIYPTLKK